MSETLCSLWVFPVIVPGLSACPWLWLLVSLVPRAPCWACFLSFCWAPPGLQRLTHRPSFPSQASLCRLHAVVWRVCLSQLTLARLFLLPLYWLLGFLFASSLGAGILAEPTRRAGALLYRSLRRDLSAGALSAPTRLPALCSSHS